MSYYKTQLENWLKPLDVKADRVLDVGGGALPVKNRVKSWDVKEYKILDNELEEGFKQKPDYIADIQDYDKMMFVMLYKENDEMVVDLYDVVFCLVVFEYIWNPVQALKNINSLMILGGTLYVSFPFIYPHHNPVGCDYLRYTRWGVEKLMKEAGFEIIDIKSRIIEVSDLNYIWRSENMHPAKEFKNHNEIGYLVKAKSV